METYPQVYQIKWMMKPRSDNFQFSVDEAQREVDHQIETHRHHEELAWEIFRLLVGFIGIFIPIAAVLFSEYFSDNSTNRLSSYIFSLIPEFELSDTSQIISNEFGTLGELSSGIVVVSLVVLASVSFVIGFLNLFIRTPRYAYLVHSTDELKSTSNITQDLGDPSIQEEDILSDYESVISHNREIVSSSKESWNNCVKTIGNGVKWLFLFIASISIFVVSNEFIIPFLTVFVIVYSVVMILEYGSFENFIKFLPHPYIIASLTLISSAIISHYKYHTSFEGILFIFGLLLSVYKSIRSEYSEMYIQSGLTMFYTMIYFGIMIVIEQGAHIGGTRMPINVGLALDLFGMLFFFSAFLFGLASLLFLHQIYIKVKNRTLYIWDIIQDH